MDVALNLATIGFYGKIASNTRDYLFATMKSNAKFTFPANKKEINLNYRIFYLNSIHIGEEGVKRDAADQKLCLVFTV